MAAATYLHDTGGSYITGAPSRQSGTTPEMDGIQFVLFDISEELIEAWRHAFEEHVPEAARSQFTIKLTQVEDESFPEEQFDCIVSPANSYGRLDGR